MKRLFAILILAILLAAACVPTVAFATTPSARYLEIDRDNVFLYENTRRAPALFEIPRTFYALIVDENYDPEYALVRYNGVEGLVKKTDLSGKVVADVVDPYYTSTNISAHITAVLYTNPSFESATTLSAYGLTLPYLGKVQGERGTYGTTTWFAVLSGDKVYFLHSAMTENLDLLESGFSPVHPNSVVAEPTSAEETATGDAAKSSSEDRFDLVRLLLILGMIVPIVIILFLLFRPKRRSNRVKRSSDRDHYDHRGRYGRDRYYRDEEDYDDY